MSLEYALPVLGLLEQSLNRANVLALQEINLLGSQLFDSQTYTNDITNASLAAEI